MVSRGDTGSRGDQPKANPGHKADADPGGHASEAGSVVPLVEAPEIRYDLRVLESLRRIIRALHLHSRKLAAEHDITAPQLLCLMTVAQEEFLGVASIARRVHLSSSTVIGILDRLESKGMVLRERDKQDRRLVNVMATERGRELVAMAPSPLQGTLVEALRQLPQLEQSTIALSLERIVDLMEAKEIAPAPFLDAGVEAKPLPEEKARSPQQGEVIDPATDVSTGGGTNRP